MNKHPPKKAFVTPVEIAQGGSGSVKQRFDPNPFDEVNFEMEPSYLIKGILPRVGLTIVWGAGLVVIVHHCGHEGTRPRGHSSLIGALDAQIAVKRDEADNVIATVELLKDGLQGDEFFSRLEIVEVGKDTDGDEVTSCVIEAVEGIPARKKTKTLPAAAAKVLKALHEILDDAGIIPPADPYIPPGTKAVIIAEWRAQAFKRGIGGGELKLSQQAFRRAFNYLRDNHRVAVSEPYAWPL